MILNKPRPRKGNRRTATLWCGEVKAKLVGIFCRTPWMARVSGWAPMAQGVRNTRRGEGAPIALPEAVEGVAVVCCCSSVADVDAWKVAMRSERIKSNGRKGKNERRKGNKKRFGR